MSNLDELYERLQQAKNDRQRQNFDAFFTGLYSGLEKDLDEAFNKNNSSGEYLVMVNRLKNKGFKVMRNKIGKHKVEMR